MSSLPGCSCAADEKHSADLRKATSPATTNLKQDHSGYMQERSGRNHKIQLVALPILLLPINCVSGSRDHLDGIQCKVSAIGVIYIQYNSDSSLILIQYVRNVQDLN